MLMALQGVVGRGIYVTRIGARVVGAGLPSARGLTMSRCDRPKLLMVGGRVVNQFWGPRRVAAPRLLQPVSKAESSLSCSVAHTHTLIHCLSKWPLMFDDDNPHLPPKKTVAFNQNAAFLRSLSDVSLNAVLKTTSNAPKNFHPHALKKRKVRKKANLQWLLIFSYIHLFVKLWLQRWKHTCMAPGHWRLTQSKVSDSVCCVTDQRS